MLINGIEMRVVAEYPLCIGHLNKEHVIYWCKHCKLAQSNLECFFFEDSGRMVYDVQPIIPLRRQEPPPRECMGNMQLDDWQGRE